MIWNTVLQMIMQVTDQKDFIKINIQVLVFQRLSLFVLFLMF